MKALFDTHVHTAEVSPCGQVSNRQIARLYKSAGYDGIVTTDHFTSGISRRLRSDSWDKCVAHFLRGYLGAAAEGRKIGLEVLLGLEITFDHGPAGDFLVYGATEDFLLSHPGILSGDLADFRRLIDEETTLIYQAHPFRPGHALAPPELLDGIEVINGNPRHDHDTARAYNTAIRHNLKQLAGSDAHRTEDVGRAGVSLQRLPGAIEDFVSMLKEDAVDIVRFDGGDRPERLRA